MIPEQIDRRADKWELYIAAKKSERERKLQDLGLSDKSVAEKLREGFEILAKHYSELVTEIQEKYIY